MNIGTMKVVIIFVISVAAFVFLSRVLYIHNLPQVVVEQAVGANISRQHRAGGNVRVSEYDDIIANEDGIVILHVSEGDRVHAGQLLYSIEVDIRNLEDRLIALEHNRDRQNVQIMRINNDIRHRRDAGIRPPVRAPLNLFELDVDIENIRTRIANTEEERVRLQSLYDVGAAPRANVDAIYRELDLLNDQLNIAIERRQNVIDRYEDDLARDAETYEQARSDNARILADLNFQLQTARLELTSIENEIDRVNEQLIADGIYEHRSEVSGEIMRIHDAARGGRRVFQNTALMNIRPDDAGLYAVFSLPNDVDFVELGQNVNLNIRNRRNIQGTIDNIRFFHSHFDVYVSFESPADANIQVGERAETVFERTSILYPRTLPNSAIREMWWQRDGYFVYVIERDRGFFGYIYFLQIQGIMVQEEGPARTAISDTFPGDMDVVVGSSQTISPGQRVRIVPRLTR